TGGQCYVRDMTCLWAETIGGGDFHRLLIDLDVDADSIASRRGADPRRSQSLPDALDPHPGHALLLAQGLRIGLVIGHPANLDEEVLVVWVSALLLEGRGDIRVAIDVDLRAQCEVPRAVAVEINASGSERSAAALVRLPAVGEPVTVCVDH